MRLAVYDIIGGDKNTGRGETDMAKPMAGQAVRTRCNHGKLMRRQRRHKFMGAEHRHQAFGAGSLQLFQKSDFGLGIKVGGDVFYSLDSAPPVADPHYFFQVQAAVFRPNLPGIIDTILRIDQGAV
ncbi:MAG: hypothetical protein BWY75_00716 [bacterium ADurb.Bin425]|nr:MAG: hypothetical protein BWY75_00716 [bacterium ADurb.Bin425]